MFISAASLCFFFYHNDDSSVLPLWECRHSTSIKNHAARNSNALTLNDLAFDATKYNAIGLKWTYAEDGFRPAFTSTGRVMKQAATIARNNVCQYFHLSAHNSTEITMPNKEDKTSLAIVASPCLSLSADYIHTYVFPSPLKGQLRYVWANLEHIKMKGDKPTYFRRYH